MTHRWTAAVLLAALSAASAPGVAGATPVPGPPGAPCSMAETVVAPAERSGGNRAALVQGGPLAGDGTLRCSIQVGHPAHSAYEATSATATGETVVTLAPVTVSWTALQTDAVYLCTAFHVAGGPVLYWDADHSLWAAAPAPCLLLGSSPGPPDEVKGLQATPYYPQGVIEISSLAPGTGTSYRFVGFDPHESQWECVFGSTSVKCTPPPPGENSYNVCATVTVQVAAGGSVGVEGSSACAYGRAARARASAAWTASASADAAAPHAAFAWTCQASPHQLTVQWSVRCTVAA